MASPAPGREQVCFGVYVADLRTGELRKHGLRIPLQERPFQVLAALLERPGEVVTRDELREHLWPPGVYVDFDHSISSAINKLRAALNDSAKHPHFIETVGRRGYRFLYPVTYRTEAEEQEPLLPAPETPTQTVVLPHRRWRIWLAGIAAVISLAILSGSLWRYRRAVAEKPIRSIAVLPLRNLSNDPEQEYFSEGLTDELITRLASLPGLLVISRASTLEYGNTRKSRLRIAQELHVDALVEGSVLRSGNRVRINVSLIDAGTDRLFWTSSYEREHRDILELQNDVARDIAQSIRLNLNPADRRRLARSQPLDPEAHEDYLRGRFHWSRRTAPELKAAVRYFDSAIARDPNYARAYAGLADAYALISSYHFAPAMEAIPKARVAALKALQLNNDLAEAHTSLALIHENYDYDWKNAEKEFRRAIDLDPNYATAHQWYAEMLAFQGRFEQALDESTRALQLDPRSLIIATDRAAIFYFARQYDRAIEELRAVQAVDPSFEQAHIIIGAYIQKKCFRRPWLT